MANSSLKLFNLRRETPKELVDHLSAIGKMQNDPLILEGTHNPEEICKFFIKSGKLPKGKLIFKPAKFTSNHDEQKNDINKCQPLIDLINQSSETKKTALSKCNGWLKSHPNLAHPEKIPYLSLFKKRPNSSQQILSAQNLIDVFVNTLYFKEDSPSHIGLSTIISKAEDLKEKSDEQRQYLKHFTTAMEKISTALQSVKEAAKTHGIKAPEFQYILGKFSEKSVPLNLNLAKQRLKDSATTIRTEPEHTYSRSPSG
jgi:hypothetical protein